MALRQLAGKATGLARHPELMRRIRERFLWEFILSVRLCENSPFALREPQDERLST